MDITEEIREEEAMSGKLKITENTKGGDATETTGDPAWSV